MVFT